MPAVHAIYDALIEHFHSRLNALDEATQADLSVALASYDVAETAVNGEDAEAREKKLQEKEQITTAITAKRQREVDVVKKAAANVWITQMKFARRAEVRSASYVFAKAPP